MEYGRLLTTVSISVFYSERNNNYQCKNVNTFSRNHDFSLCFADKIWYIIAA